MSPLPPTAQKQRLSLCGSHQAEGFESKYVFNEFGKMRRSVRSHEISAWYCVMLLTNGKLGVKETINLLIASVKFDNAFPERNP